MRPARRVRRCRWGVDRHGQLLRVLAGTSGLGMTGRSALDGSRCEQRGSGRQCPQRQFAGHDDASSRPVAGQCGVIGLLRALPSECSCLRYEPTRWPLHRMSSGSKDLGGGPWMIGRVRSVWYCSRSGSGASCAVSRPAFEPGCGRGCVAGLDHAGVGSSPPASCCARVSAWWQYCGSTGCLLRCEHGVSYRP